MKIINEASVTTLYNIYENTNMKINPQLARYNMVVAYLFNFLLFSLHVIQLMTDHIDIVLHLFVLLVEVQLNLFSTSTRLQTVATNNNTQNTSK